MRRLVMSLSAAAFGVTCFTTVAHAGVMFKCKDATGKTVYSDTDCRTNIPVVAPRAKDATTEPLVKVAKLTEPVVEKLLRHAMTLGENGDHESQCALAATDLSFTIVDQSVSPEMRKTGGRKDICKLQRDSAIELRQNGVSARTALSQIRIQVNPEGTQATASYLLKVQFSAASATFGVRCERNDQFGLYDGRVLFKRVDSVCAPAS